MTNHMIFDVRDDNLTLEEILWIATQVFKLREAPEEIQCRECEERLWAAFREVGWMQ